MGRGELTENGYIAVEDGIDSKGIVIPKSDDKKAAKVAEYRKLESVNETLEAEIDNYRQAVEAYEDKLAQIIELGYSFNDSGVLVEPVSNIADDPA